jgi:leucyl/phenylalanyl-tRNA--protein transferase
MSGSSRQTLQRWVLGLLWSLKPPRLYGVPATLLMLARHYTGLGPAPGTLPDPAQALRFPDGLAGICTDMSVPTLTAAYAKGLFPLAHIGPQKWWAPAERIISFPDSGHISKNVRRLLRVEQFEVTFDTAFDAVIAACAEPRPERPHSPGSGRTSSRPIGRCTKQVTPIPSKCGDRSGNLAGGLYGVEIGKAFFTESIFARQPDASKVAFIALSCHLQLLNDGKHDSPHLAKLGFRLMPKAELNLLLTEACAEPGKPGRWTVEPQLDLSRWEPKAGSGQARSMAPRPL